MRRAVAIALFVTVLGTFGCGGAPGRLAAPTPLGAASACVGRSAVHRSQLAMERRSEITGARRRLDPIVWAPDRRGCAPPLVLFSHGHYGNPAGCSRLCAHLAGQGFVVLAPLHPDRATATRAQGPERVEDLLFLLDHLAAVRRRLVPPPAGG